MRYFLTMCMVFVFAFAKAQQPVYKGQAPIKIVPTESKPTQRQWKGVYDLGDVHFSNDFAGGRLNGVIKTSDSTYTALITSENTPVNMSPWYTFKVWSTTSKNISLTLTYQDNAKHRYWPKISTDGIKFINIDSTQVTEYEKGTADFGYNSLAVSIKMELALTSKPLLITAQELETSEQVNDWTKALSTKKFVNTYEIGKSTEGRTMQAIAIGKPKSKRMLMVISRQHPPEVTGYLAMQSFIATITGDTKLARRFKRKFTTYVVPLMNPDGVDNGHWRHNMGGIDLNRDWQNFNQLETRNVRDFMLSRVAATSGKFYFGIDFHSTWDDIYYTMAPEFKGNMPGLIPDWLAGIKKETPGYNPTIRPSDKLYPTSVSRNFFLATFGAEAIVFEIGDNTDRDFIKEKGRISAEQLMQLMLKRL